MRRHVARWMYPLLAAALATMPGVSVMARADGPPKKPPATKEKEAEEPKPDFPKFEEVCKDFEQIKPGDLDESGFLTLWYNKKTDQLFAQIPGGLVNQQFLIASSISGGPFATGFQIDHWLAYFEKMDKNLVLMRVDTRYARDDSQPVSDVVKRSYTDEIVRSVSIRTMKGSDPVIDLGDLFKGDFLNLFGFMGPAEGEAGMSVNPSLSKWASYKTFSQNSELSVDMAMVGRGGGRRMRMHYSLSSVPKADYKPRMADDRVGYFMTVRYDWGKKYGEKTLFNRYVNRWNLQKSDPSLEMSPPKEPIIWYIEKTVPIRWRRYVAEGILEWNKAFEKCGYVNAVQVRQQESNNEFARYDPEDVRWNFFRWIVTGEGFAMGPSRDHPLTGQIFDADIVFDDSMIRHYVIEYERMTGGSESWSAFNPFLESFFRAHPEWQYRSCWSRLMPNVREQTDAFAELKQRLMRRMAERGRPLCEYASGMGHQLALARLSMEADGMTPAKNEEFLGQVVKEIVMHEVGHCLGLRHNFKASTWKTMQEVAEHDTAGDANVGSVMDYNPPILSRRGAKQGSYTTRSIGPYDYWAIGYGYKTPGKDDKSEEEMLKKIAGHATEEGLAYATDEDTFGVLSADPLSNRFDMGKDPMEYAQRQLELANSLLVDVTKWGVKDGESYSRLRRTFRRLVAEKARVCAYIARFPGGQYVNRDHRGDANARAPITPVEPDRQRKAREFVEKHVFAEDAYSFSPELLNLLAPGRYWHWDSDDFDFQQEFNIHDLAAAGQHACLFTMMNPFTIIRIHDAEVKYPADTEPYTLAEHMLGLTDAIWTELDTSHGKEKPRRPLINSFRRNLQRMHLDMMLNYVLTSDESFVPADAVALARMSAADLSAKIDSLPLDRIDPTSRAHLRDSKKRIDKALEAEYTRDRRGAEDIGFFLFRPTPQAEDVVPVLPSR